MKILGVIAIEIMEDEDGYHNAIAARLHGTPKKAVEAAVMSLILRTIEKDPEFLELMAKTFEKYFGSENELEETK